METYLTEEERLEALQRWWKENKTSIFYGLLLGLALIAGWRMWQGNKQETAQQASLAYHQLTEALQAKQNDSALKQAERLIQQFPSTTYAEFARLFMARLKVEAGDLDAARKILEEELSHSKDEPLKHIVRLRLARVMLAKGEVDPALKLLDAVPAASIGKFEAQYAEVRGDLLAAAKRAGEARAAYAKAKELGDASPMLELKLNDLPAAP